MSTTLIGLSRRLLKAAPLTAWSRGAADKAWTVVKAGNNILLDGVPYEVTKAIQGGRGRGGSFVKTKLKNLLTGKGSDRTFKSEEPVEVPDLDKYAVDYSWEDADAFVFMDSSTFEEFRVPKSVVEKSLFLLPGHSILIFMHNDAVIKIVHPHIAQFKVVSVDLGEKV
jgi:elongation factor P